MKAASQVLIGYEVPTGEPVEIPINGHLCVTGMTQMAGKTTVLDALITRSGRDAITFITKRGEMSFERARRIKPYFRERADWQFVESILEATMRQKMKFERGWIMRASRGARTLEDVKRNIEKAMETAKGLSADIYMQLHAYLDIVLPQIGKLDYANKVEIGPGLNVMDLVAYSSELQALIIRSVLEWVHEKENGVIVVIPEAWETLPEGRSSPVKLACEQLFRKGAGIGNLVWLDSQDIAGVWKEALRACSVWIMGVQGEINEVKRMLAHLPTPNSLKPKPEQVMTLQRGQFYVRYGRELKLVYVQPVWLDGERAAKIARGAIAMGEIVQPEDRNLDYKAKYEEALAAIEELRREIDKLNKLKRRDQPGTLNRLEGATLIPKAVEGAKAHSEPVRLEHHTGMPLEEVYDYVRQRIVEDAPILKLAASVPEIVVEKVRIEIKASHDTLRGRLAGMIAEGIFDQSMTGNSAFEYLKSAAFSTSKPNVYKELDKITTLGFLTKGSAQGEGYKAVEGMKVRIVET